MDDERRAISDVLPWLGRVGNEAAAGSLLTRLAEIEQACGGSDDRILQLVERAVAITRRTFGLAPASERALARLRVKAKRVPALPSVHAFLQAWRASFPDLPFVLERLAPAVGVSLAHDLAASLEQQLGPEASLTWLVWSTASLCRQLRDAGESAMALNVAAGTQPMPLTFGDRQMSAILRNECGLNLLALKHPERALEQFTHAIADATAAGDLAELVDDHVNAADACEALGRLDDAVHHLAQARQSVEVRQDFQTATEVALRLGELFKTLKRNPEALEEFQTAEYFIRTLGPQENIDQVVVRLGKLYREIGEFEASIRYRDELMISYASQGQPAAAAPFALLVANTYDEQLDRPRDAVPYYRRALSLNEHGGPLNANDLQDRLARCQARAGGAGVRLWDLLLEHEPSPDAAEQTAARLAMAVDFNLWRFEPQSFSAWYERVFKGAVSYPVKNDPELPIWPFAVVYQLVALARSARELHRHDDSLRHAHSAEQIARAFGIAQGQYLAAEASAVACAELRRQDLHAEHLARAQTIRREFDAAAAIRGLQAFEAGTKILEPWNVIGLLLALRVPGIPSQSTRHSVVKGRLVDEFFMRPAPSQSLR
jgi:tetratricopeptide (TPR) repeat protein